jgi:hypothetical protein
VFEKAISGSYRVAKFQVKNVENVSGLYYRFLFTKLLEEGLFSDDGYVDAAILDPNFEVAASFDDKEDPFDPVEWTPQDDMIFVSLPDNFTQTFFLPAVYRNTCKVEGVDPYPIYSPLVAAIGYPCVIKGKPFEG